MATVPLVDDDPKIRELLRVYVEREGHRTLAAADGEMAVASALRSRPDLVIVDVMLPGLDGFEVCRGMREASDAPWFQLPTAVATPVGMTRTARST